MARRGSVLGKWGEDQACGFLERQGFSVLDRNYHTTAGEIDIVAKKEGDFYFVEVKTREAGPMQYDVAITYSKKQKFLKTMRQYCSRFNIKDAGLVPVGLMVVADRKTHKVAFRLAVLY